MIGRFLLGSGLGALVGTGMLALVSIFSPVPIRSPAGLADPAVADQARTPAPAASDAVAPDTGPATALAPGPVADKVAPDDATDDAPTVEVPAAAKDATLLPAEEDSAESVPGEPGAPVADVGITDAVPSAPKSDAPAALAGAKEDTAPTVPDLADAPQSSSAPADLGGLEGDGTPTATEVPAQAPKLSASTAPDALAEPGKDGMLVATPAEIAAPASPLEPLLPDAPQPEVAPLPADLPAPPPLTPEEEAQLRQLAEESPGNATPESGATPAAPEEPVAAAPESAETTPLAEAPAEEPPVAEAAPSPEVATEPAQTGEVVPKPDSDGSTLPSAPSLTDDADGVTTGRLPRIGDAEPVAEAAKTPSDLPLRRYARPFENAESKPVFAIVLIDDGAADLDRAALAALPFPVSFALDPTDPNAAANAAIYRAAGQEVLMLATAIPNGAQASDVEVALSAMAQALPEAVAVMDTPARSFQADRPLAGLVVPVIGGQGRGLLTWDQGLNAADQVARREDVPSTVAFRDLDGGDEAAPVIRRYLDRAAFKAAQDGRVTVIGRTRPETVAAILEWTVEGRAATVALAPISAAMSVE